MKKIHDEDAEVYVGEVSSRQTLRGQKYVIVKSRDKTQDFLPGTPFSEDIFDDIPEWGDWVLVYMDQHACRHGKILKKYSPNSSPVS